MTGDTLELWREQGRASIAKRPRVVITCAVCGASKTTYASAKYCSNACRQKAKYRRGKGQPVTEVEAPTPTPSSTVPLRPCQRCGSMEHAPWCRASER